MPSSSPTNERRGSDGRQVPLAAEVIAHFDLSPCMADIFRTLGYPRGVTPPSEQAGMIERLVAGALPHLHPRGTYALYAVTGQDAHALTAGGATIKGSIGEFLHGANRIAVFIVTVGREITRMAEASCHAGDPFSGWALDAIGSWGAEAAADAMMISIQRHLSNDESLTMRYSPGYCGMDLRQQPTLFRLAPAESVGITLLPSHLMQPMKSVSGIVGLGPKELVGVNLSPCDRCPQVGCHMRR
jgi:hypothetical protein